MGNKILWVSALGFLVAVLAAWAWKSLGHPIIFATVMFIGLVCGIFSVCVKIAE